MKAGQTVAVTGATGFIGGYVARALVEGGSRVVAAVRDPARARALDGVELRRADLGDEDALARAFKGASAVVAAAAIVSLGTWSPEDVLRTNVEGTRHVVRAAHRAGAGHIVLISSVGAYRPKRDRFWTEDDPIRDPSAVHRLNAYGVSKAASERAATELCDALGVALTIVRPSAVHGAFDRSTLSAWMARFLAPPITVFPSRLSIPSVYAGDLALACRRALRRKEVSAGRAYNIAGDPGQTFWDLQVAWREAHGGGPRVVIPVPVPLRWIYDTTRARAELDFVNRPLADGFRDAMRLEELP